MQDNEAVCEALMSALPQPRSNNEGGRGETLGPSSPNQVFVDAVGRVVDGSHEYIANHERRLVTARVLPVSKSINAVDHVLATKTGVGAGNALAFDDGVRVLYRRLEVYFKKEQRNVCQAIRHQRCLRR